MAAPTPEYYLDEGRLKELFSRFGHANLGREEAVLLNAVLNTFLNAPPLPRAVTVLWDQFLMTNMIPASMMLEIAKKHNWFARDRKIEIQKMGIERLVGKLHQLMMLFPHHENSSFIVQNVVTSLFFYEPRVSMKILQALPCSTVDHCSIIQSIINSLYIRDTLEDTSFQQFLLEFIRKNQLTEPKKFFPPLFAHLRSNRSPFMKKDRSDHLLAIMLICIAKTGEYESFPQIFDQVATASISNDLFFDYLSSTYGERVILSMVERLVEGSEETPLVEHFGAIAEEIYHSTHFGTLTLPYFPDVELMKLLRASNRLVQKGALSILLRKRKLDSVDEKKLFNEYGIHYNVEGKSTKAPQKISECMQLKLTKDKREEGSLSKNEIQKLQKIFKLYSGEKESEKRMNELLRLDALTDSYFMDFERSSGLVMTSTMKHHLEKIQQYILAGNPILLEGNTGVGKTALVEALANYNGVPLIRFNMSSLVSVDDLLGKLEFNAKDKTPSFSYNAFTKAFKDGAWLLLDELNLAPDVVLQRIEGALDQGVLQLNNPSRVDPIEYIERHLNFRLFATQNPNKGLFKGKREILSESFLDRFVHITFPDVTKEECHAILCAMAETHFPKNLSEKQVNQIVSKMITFHFDFQSKVKKLRFADSYKVITLRELVTWCKSLNMIADLRVDHPLLWWSAWTIYISRFDTKQQENFSFPNIRMELSNFTWRMSASDISIGGISFPRPKRGQEKASVQAEVFSVLLNYSTSVEFITRFGLTRLPELLPSLQENSIQECGTYYIQLFRDMEARKELNKAMRRYFKKKWKLLTIPSPSPPGESSLIPYIVTDRVLDIWKKVLFGMSMGQPILIMGNEGCGKSDTIIALAYLLGIDVSTLCLTPEVEASALVGQYVPNHDSTAGLVKWSDGVVTDAYRTGRWSLLDNLNEAHAEVLERINPVLETRSQLVLTEAGETTPVIRHDTFHMFATMTANTGSTAISQAELSPALANRFTIIWMGDIETTEIDKMAPKICVTPTSAMLTLAKRLYSHYVTLRSIIRFLDNSFKLRKVKCFRSEEERLMISYHLCYTSQLKSSQLQEKEEEQVKTLLYGSKGQPRGQLLFPLVDKYFSKDKKVAHVLTASRKPYAETVLACYLCNLPVLLEGPSAVGKTSLISEIASLVLGSESNHFKRINNTETTTVQDYIGTFLPNGSEIIFLKGPLREALEEGKWFLTDEFNLAEPSVLTMLSPLLEGKRSIRVPVTGEVLVAHPNFRFFATQNDSSYANRHELPASLRNRFVQIEVEDFTVEEVEEILCNRLDTYSDTTIQRSTSKHYKLLAEVYSKLRKVSGSSITLRELIRWCRRFHQMKLTDDRKSWMTVGKTLISPQQPSYTQKKLDDIFKKNQLGEQVYKVEQDKTLLRFSFGKMVVRLPGTLKNSPLFHSRDYVPPRSFIKHLVLFAFACDQREPILLIGPASMKTLLVHTWCQITNRPEELVSVFLTPETEASDIIGEVHPFSYPDYQNSIQRILHQLTRLLPCLTENQKYLKVRKNIISLLKQQEVRREYIELLHIKNLLPSLKAIVHAASKSYKEPLRRGSVAHMIDRCEMLATYLIESRNLDKPEQTAFRFKEGPVTTAIHSGHTLLLEDFDLPSQAVTERLNSLLETEPSFCISEDLTNKSQDVFILPSLQIIATVHQEVESGSLSLSPATLSRFTVIRVPGYPKEEMRHIFTSNLSQIMKKETCKFSKSFIDAVAELVVKELSKARTSLSLFNIFNWFRFIENHRDPSSKGNGNIDSFFLRLLQGAFFCQIGLFHREEDFVACSSSMLDKARDQLSFQTVHSNALPIRYCSAVHGIQVEYGKLVLPKHPDYHSQEVTINMEFTERLVSDMSYIVAGIISHTPILLIGPPGSGKTCAISELASLLEIPCERINLSGNVTKDELFGRLVSSQGGFKQVEGPIPRALREGSWILLDEINLGAPELLNSLTKYLQLNYKSGSEGIPSTFHLFATMNPSSTVGRSKLPPSIENLFSTIHIRQYNEIEMEQIFRRKLAEKGLVRPDLMDEALMGKIFRVHQEICSLIDKKKVSDSFIPTVRELVKLKDVIFGNLEDQLAHISADPKLTSLSAENKKIVALTKMLELVYTRSFECPKDQSIVNTTIKRVLSGGHTILSPSKIIQKQNFVNIGSAYVKIRHKELASLHPSIVCTPTSISHLEMIALASQSHRPVLLEGDTAVAKTALVAQLATLAGRHLITIPMSDSTSTSDLIGQYVLHPASTIIDKMRSILKEMFPKLFELFLISSAYFDVFEKFQALEHFQTAKIKPFHWPKTVSSLLSEDFIQQCRTSTSSLLMDRILILKGMLKTLRDHTVHLNRKTKNSHIRFSFVDSEIIHAMEHGKWVLLDNVNCATQDVVERLNSLFEENSSLHVFESDLSKRYSRSSSNIDHTTRLIHPDFRIFMTSNPGRIYSHTLSPALLNRVIQIHIAPLDNDKEMLCAMAQQTFRDIKGGCKLVDLCVDFYYELKKEEKKEGNQLTIRTFIRTLQMITSHLRRTQAEDPYLITCSALLHNFCTSTAWKRKLNFFTKRENIPSGSFVLGEQEKEMQAEEPIFAVSRSIFAFFLHKIALEVTNLSEFSSIVELLVHDVPTDKNMKEWISSFFQHSSPFLPSVDEFGTTMERYISSTTINNAKERLTLLREFYYGLTRLQDLLSRKSEHFSFTDIEKKFIPKVMQYQHVLLFLEIPFVLNTSAFFDFCAKMKQSHIAFQFEQFFDAPIGSIGTEKLHQLCADLRTSLGKFYEPSDVTRFYNSFVQPLNDQLLWLRNAWEFSASFASSPVLQQLRLSNTSTFFALPKSIMNEIAICYDLSEVASALYKEEQSLTIQRDTTSITKAQNEMKALQKRSKDLNNRMKVIKNLKNQILTAVPDLSQFYNPNVSYAKDTISVGRMLDEIQSHIEVVKNKNWLAMVFADKDLELQELEKEKNFRILPAMKERKAILDANKLVQSRWKENVQMYKEQCFLLMHRREDLLAFDIHSTLCHMARIHCTSIHNSLSLHSLPSAFSTFCKDSHFTLPFVRNHFFHLLWSSFYLSGLSYTTSQVPYIYMASEMDMQRTFPQPLSDWLESNKGGTFILFLLGKERELTIFACMRKDNEILVTEFLPPARLAMKSHWLVSSFSKSFSISYRQKIVNCFTTSLEDFIQQSLVQIRSFLSLPPGNDDFTRLSMDLDAYPIDNPYMIFRRLINELDLFLSRDAPQCSSFITNLPKSMKEYIDRLLHDPTWLEMLSAETGTLCKLYYELKTAKTLFTPTTLGGDEYAITCIENEIKKGKKMDILLPCFFWCKALDDCMTTLTFTAIQRPLHISAPEYKPLLRILQSCSENKKITPAHLSTLQECSKRFKRYYEEFGINLDTFPFKDLSGREFSIENNPLAAPLPVALPLTKLIDHILHLKQDMDILMMQIQDRASSNASNDILTLRSEVALLYNSVHNSSSFPNQRDVSSFHKQYILLRKRLDSLQSKWSTNAQKKERNTKKAKQRKLENEGNRNIPPVLRNLEGLLPEGSQEHQELFHFLDSQCKVFYFQLLFASFILEGYNLRKEYSTEEWQGFASYVDPTLDISSEFFCDSLLDSYTSYRKDLIHIQGSQFNNVHSIHSFLDASIHPSAMRGNTLYIQQQYDFLKNQYQKVSQLIERHPSVPFSLHPHHFLLSDLVSFFFPECYVSTVNKEVNILSNQHQRCTKINTNNLRSVLLDNRFCENGIPFVHSGAFNRLESHLFGSKEGPGLVLSKLTNSFSENPQDPKLQIEICAQFHICLLCVVRKETCESALHNPERRQLFALLSAKLESRYQTAKEYENHIEKKGFQPSEMKIGRDELKEQMEMAAISDSFRDFLLFVNHYSNAFAIYYNRAVIRVLEEQGRMEEGNTFVLFDLYKDLASLFSNFPSWCKEASSIDIRKRLEEVTRTSKKVLQGSGTLYARVEPHLVYLYRLFLYCISNRGEILNETQEVDEKAAIELQIITAFHSLPLSSHPTTYDLDDDRTSLLQYFPSVYKTLQTPSCLLQGTSNVIDILSLRRALLDHISSDSFDQHIIHWSRISISLVKQFLKIGKQIWVKGTPIPPLFELTFQKFRSMLTIDDISLAHINSSLLQKSDELHELVWELSEKVRPFISPDAISTLLGITHQYLSETFIIGTNYYGHILKRVGDKALPARGFSIADFLSCNMDGFSLPVISFRGILKAIILDTISEMQQFYASVYIPCQVSLKKQFESIFTNRNLTLKDIERYTKRQSGPVHDAICLLRAMQIGHEDSLSKRFPSLLKLQSYKEYLFPLQKINSDMKKWSAKMLRLPEKIIPDHLLPTAKRLFPPTSTIPLDEELIYFSEMVRYYAENVVKECKGNAVFLSLLPALLSSYFDPSREFLPVSLSEPCLKLLRIRIDVEILDPRVSLTLLENGAVPGSELSPDASSFLTISGNGMSIVVIKNGASKEEIALHSFPAEAEWCNLMNSTWSMYQKEKMNANRRSYKQYEEQGALIQSMLKDTEWHGEEERRDLSQAIIHSPSYSSILTISDKYEKYIAKVMNIGENIEAMDLSSASTRLAINWDTIYKELQQLHTLAKQIYLIELPTDEWLKKQTASLSLHYENLCTCHQQQKEAIKNQLTQIIDAVCNVYFACSHTADTSREIANCKLFSFEFLSDSFPHWNDKSSLQLGLKGIKPMLGKKQKKLAHRNVFVRAGQFDVLQKSKSLMDSLADLSESSETPYLELYVVDNKLSASSPDFLLHFGNLLIGKSTSSILVLHNKSTSNLSVEFLLNSDAPYSVTPSTAFRLDASKQMTVKLDIKEAKRPTSAIPGGTLCIKSGKKLLKIPFTAEGQIFAPAMHFEVETYDLGYVECNHSKGIVNRYVTVINDCPATLRIDVALELPPSDTPHISVTLNGFLVLQENGRKEIMVSYHSKSNEVCRWKGTLKASCGPKTITTTLFGESTKPNCILRDHKKSEVSPNNITSTIPFMETQVDIKSKPVILSFKNEGKMRIDGMFEAGQNCISCSDKTWSVGPEETKELTCFLLSSEEMKEEKITCSFRYGNQWSRCIQVQFACTVKKKFLVDPQIAITSIGTKRQLIEAVLSFKQNNDQLISLGLSPHIFLKSGNVVSKKEMPDIIYHFPILEKKENNRRWRFTLMSNSPFTNLTLLVNGMWITKEFDTPSKDISILKAEVQKGKQFQKAKQYEWLSWDGKRITKPPTPSKDIHYGEIFSGRKGSPVPIVLFSSSYQFSSLTPQQVDRMVRPMYDCLVGVSASRFLNSLTESGMDSISQLMDLYNPGNTAPGKSYQKVQYTALFPQNVISFLWYHSDYSEALWTYLLSNGQWAGNERVKRFSRIKACLLKNAEWDFSILEGSGLWKSWRSILEYATKELDNANAITSLMANLTTSPDLYLLCKEILHEKSSDLPSLSFLHHSTCDKTIASRSSALKHSLWGEKSGALTLLEHIQDMGDLPKDGHLWSILSAFIDVLQSSNTLSFEVQEDKTSIPASWVQKLAIFFVSTHNEATSLANAIIAQSKASYPSVELLHCISTSLSYCTVTLGKEQRALLDQLKLIFSCIGDSTNSIASILHEKKGKEDYSFLMNHQKLIEKYLEDIQDLTSFFHTCEEVIILFEDNVLQEKTLRILDFFESLLQSNSGERVFLMACKGSPFLAWTEPQYDLPKHLTRLLSGKPKNIFAFFHRLVDSYTNEGVAETAQSKLLHSQLLAISDLLNSPYPPPNDTLHTCCNLLKLPTVTPIHSKRSGSENILSYFRSALKDISKTIPEIASLYKIIMLISRLRTGKEIGQWQPRMAIVLINFIFEFWKTSVSPPNDLALAATRDIIALSFTYYTDEAKKPCKLDFLLMCSLLACYDLDPSPIPVVAHMECFNMLDSLIEVDTMAPKVPVPSPVASTVKASPVIVRKKDVDMERMLIVVKTRMKELLDLKAKLPPVVNTPDSWFTYTLALQDICQKWVILFGDMCRTSQEGFRTKETPSIVSSYVATGFTIITRLLSFQQWLLSFGTHTARRVTLELLDQIRDVLGRISFYPHDIPTKKLFIRFLNLSPTLLLTTDNTKSAEYEEEDFEDDDFESPLPLMHRHLTLHDLDTIRGHFNNHQEHQKEEAMACEASRYLAMDAGSIVQVRRPTPMNFDEDKMDINDIIEEPEPAFIPRDAIDPIPSQTPVIDPNTKMILSADNGDNSSMESKYDEEHCNLESVLGVTAEEEQFMMEAKVDHTERFAYEILAKSAVGAYSILLGNQIKKAMGNVPCEFMLMIDNSRSISFASKATQVIELSVLLCETFKHIETPFAVSRFGNTADLYFLLKQLKQAFSFSLGQQIIESLSFDQATHTASALRRLLENGMWNKTTENPLRLLWMLTDGLTNEARLEDYQGILEKHNCYLIVILVEAEDQTNHPMNKLFAKCPRMFPCSMEDPLSSIPEIIARLAKKTGVQELHTRRSTSYTIQSQSVHFPHFNFSFVNQSIRSYPHSKYVSKETLKKRNLFFTCSPQRMEIPFLQEMLQEQHDQRHHDEKANLSIHLNDLHRTVQSLRISTEELEENHRKAIEQLLPSIQSLVGVLDRLIFRPNIPTRKKCSAKGSSLYLPGLIKAVISNYNYKKFYSIKQRGGRRDYAICFLLDISLSMRGHPTACMIETLLMMIAALEEMSITRISIVLFNQHVSVLKTERETFNATLLYHILSSIPQEGISRYEDSFSNDGEALFCAIDLLASSQTRGSHHIYIMTDGISSNPKNVTAALYAAERAHIEVTAIGVGTDQYQYDRYPQWIYCAVPSTIPDALQRLHENTSDSPPSDSSLPKLLSFPLLDDTKRKKEIIKPIEEMKKHFTSFLTELRSDETLRFVESGAKPTVDICFAVDCSGSMRPYMDVLKLQLKVIGREIEKHIKDFNDSVVLQLGVISYRDKNPLNTWSNRTILPFTSSFEDFTSFIDNMEAIGGNDLPEDVLGALHEANNMFSQHSGNSRFLLCIGDAPGHGLMPHEWKKLDSEDATTTEAEYEKVLMDLLVKNVELVCVKISNLTDRMDFLFQGIVQKHAGADVDSIVCPLLQNIVPFTYERKHLVFVLDNSFSMKGERWTLLSTAYQTTIAKKLGTQTNDLLSVVTFNNRVQERANKANLNTAEGIHDIGLFSAGSTDYLSALRLVKNKILIPGIDTVLIFMTDGDPSHKTSLMKEELAAILKSMNGDVGGRLQLHCISFCMPEGEGDYLRCMVDDTVRGATLHEINENEQANLFTIFEEFAVGNTSQTTKIIDNVGKSLSKAINDKLSPDNF